MTVDFLYASVAALSLTEEEKLEQTFLWSLTNYIMCGFVGNQEVMLMTAQTKHSMEGPGALHYHARSLEQLQRLEHPMVIYRSLAQLKTIFDWTDEKPDIAATKVNRHRSEKSETSPKSSTGKLQITLQTYDPKTTYVVWLTFQTAKKSTRAMHFAYALPLFSDLSDATGKRAAAVKLHELMIYCGDVSIPNELKKLPFWNHKVLSNIHKSFLLPCAECKTKAELRCACQAVYYCGPDCQRKAWPKHKEAHIEIIKRQQRAKRRAEQLLLQEALS